MIRTLSPFEQTLLDIAKSYASLEEFKAGNLPKFLIARSKNLLKLAFDYKPPEPVEPPDILAARAIETERLKKERQIQATANIKEYFEKNK